MIEKVLHNLKISALNQMQKETIAAAENEGDIVLLAPTGSGKTVAFAIPLLQRIDVNISDVQALIIVPSRELAIQIEQVCKQAGTYNKISSCYGGHATRVEKNNLLQPPAILIGTPGRLAFHIRNENVNTRYIATLVLDEFDKSLEYGFKEDMSFIISKLRHLKKRILTSATPMSDVPSFVRLQKVIQLNYLNAAHNIAEGLQVKTVRTDAKDKLDSLFALLCKTGGESSLVFCNHREAIDTISNMLNHKGIPHGVYHGKLEQADRERALIKFRNGTHRILITTDLASRGLDIAHVQHIIHFQLPHSEEIFIHRNGRTARMQMKGTSYLLLNATEQLPPYIKAVNEEEKMPSKNVVPPPSPWMTIYAASGKKDKINKMDIVGMFMQKGKLQKDDLGLIEVLDFCSYIAVKQNKVSELLANIEGEKIKSRKVKFQIAR